MRYLFVEVAAGIITVAVPSVIAGFAKVSFPVPSLGIVIAVSALWVAVFLAILLLSLIDIRLQIIPDELSVFLVLIGVVLVLLDIPHFAATGGSFMGPYSLLLGVRENVWVNHSLAALIAGGFFLGLVFLTRGRGMGVGDVKFATALGVLFGWPDAVLVVALSFILGAFWGLTAIAFKKKGMKSLLPFGPFLGLAAFLVFFFGYQIARFYFSLFRG